MSHARSGSGTVSEVIRNLDPRCYYDAAAFQRERERIFWRTWQLLGPASQVARPGDYVAAEIAGAKVVAIHADDGVLRAFRNVCVHRGARLLEEGTGSCRAIQCPYHHWLYSLDGTLKRTPWFGEDPDFDMAEWPLQPVSVDVWRGLLFVAIDPVEPLLANLGDTVGVLADEPIETFDLYRTERLVFDANWKIYVDNFVEGYHIPGIHPSFYAAIDFEKFEAVAMNNVIKMTAPPRDDLFYRGTWLTTWPNLTLSLFDGGMNTSRVNPIDEGRTELLYHYYFADLSEENSAIRDRTVEGSLAVVREDFGICEVTHQNYASGGYRPGPLSPRHEAGVAWFQQRLAAILA
ncbi:MAG: choline monooxygenase [Ilumatobacteraceae bacterium]